MKMSTALLTGTLCAGILVAGLPAAAFSATAPPAIKPPIGAPVDGGFNAQNGASKPAPVTMAVTGLTANTVELTLAGVPGAWASIDRDGVSISKPQQLNTRGQAVVTAPLVHGEKATFSATQTVYLITDPAHIPHTSDPASIDVVSDITTLPAPRVTDVLDIDYDRVPIRVDGTPGATLEVKNSLGAVAQNGTAKINTSGYAMVMVTLRSAQGVIGPRFTVTQSYGGVTSPATAFHKDDQVAHASGDLTAPAVEAKFEHGYLNIVATSGPESDTGILQVRDLNGSLVANAPFSNGRAETNVKAPTNESHYTATVRKMVDTAINESAATSFVVNEGTGQLVPDAPTVKKVEFAGSRAVATISGAAGAVVTARDADGTVVAVKTIGAESSTTQLVVPITSRSDQKLRVTQKTDAVESDPLTVDLAGFSK